MSLHMVLPFSILIVAHVQDCMGPWLLFVGYPSWWNVQILRLGSPVGFPHQSTVLQSGLLDLKSGCCVHSV